MRDIITGLAIIVIAALTAALAAPYFIDWNGQRAFVEARLSHALGQKVTIGGAIDVKLLPTPYLVLGQTVIGGDDGPIRLSIHHLNLELSIAPLLHGEFEVVDARLDEPTIRVTLERDRTLPALPDAPAFQANVRFDRIIVNGGTLAIADPGSGRTFVIDNLDFDAEAPSLAGPFKVNGAAGAKTARTKFHFATTTAQNGRARTHLVVEETPAHAGIDLDGTVALTSAGRQTIRQSFDGTISVSGHLDQAASAPVAWRLSGPLKADPEKATLAGGQVRLGDEEAGLTLAATAEADLGSAPALRLDLNAKQLDIDRLAGPPVNGAAPPPPKLPDLATLRRALTAAMPPLPTMLDISIDNATWAGEALSDLAAHVGVGGDGPHPLQIGGNGPGGAHIGLDGTLSEGTLSDGPPSFAGAAELSADNWPRALGWLATIDPLVSLKPGDLPFKSAKLTAKVRVDADTIDASGLALTLDRSSLTGSAHVALDSQPAKVTATLDAKALDLDALPDLATLRGPARPFDLDLTLDAKAIKVSRAGTGTLDAGQINVALIKSGEHVALKSFRAQNLGGASVEASGTLDPEAAALRVTMDAAKLEAFAALVRQLAPGPIADAFVARAQALTPAKITMDAALTGKAGGGLQPTRVKLSGTLGATNVEASVEPASNNIVSLGATLDAPEGSALLRQLGLPTLPLDILGPAHVALGARGPYDQPLDTNVRARFGTTQASVVGRFALLATGQEGSGTVALKSTDLAPLLQSLALAFPDLTGTISADLSGRLTRGPTETTIGDMKGQFGDTTLTGGALSWAPKGMGLTGSLALNHLKLADLFGLALGAPQAVAANAEWSNLTFATGLVDPPRAAIALKVDTLDLAPDVPATKATMDLGLAPNLVTLSHATATLAGGTIGGAITLRRDGRQGTLDGKLALDKVAIDLPSVRTKLNATLDLAGSGPSALGLVSNLAGIGAAHLTDLVIPNADPEALPRVFADTEGDSLALDQGAIAKSLQEKAVAPLDAGTRLFGLSLVGGVVHFDEKPAASPDERPVTRTLDATLDLRRGYLDQKVRETLHAPPKTWEGPPPSVVFTWTGPLRTPTPSVDVSSFVDAVATRALARESARIEAYEFDIRERKAKIEAARTQKTRQDATDRLKTQTPIQKRSDAPD